MTTATESSKPSTPQRPRRWRPSQWFSPKADRYVGVELGHDRVRVAALGFDRAMPTTLKWYTWTEFELERLSSEMDFDQWLNAALRTLDRRMPRCVDGESTIASLTVPSSWMHYETAVSKEISSVTSRLNGAFMESRFHSAAEVKHWPINVSDERNLVVAVARDPIVKISESLSQIGYTINTVLPHGVALIHAASAMTGIQPAAAVSIDSGCGLIAVASDLGCGLCRTLPMLDLAESGSEDLDPLDAAWQAWMEQIANEIDTTLRFAGQDSDASDPSHPILLCGNHAGFRGVDERLAYLLNRPVALWQYQGQHRPKNTHPATDSDGLQNDLGSGSRHQIGLDGHNDASRSVAISLAYAAANSDLATGRKRSEVPS